MSRVLVLTPGLFDRGGIARYGAFQIRALAESRGIEELRVMSLMGRGSPGIADGVEVDWAGPPVVTSVSRLRFARSAVTISAAMSPDIVLSQHVNLAPLARLLGSSARRVINIYGHEIWSGMKLSRRSALKRADLVVADSNHGADQAKSLGLVTERPAVIWDCVDQGRFTPQSDDFERLRKYGLQNGGPFRVLFLGRLHPHTRYKGAERLLRAAAILGSTNIEVVIAGGGSDLDHLRRVAASLDVQDSTVFTGGVDDSDLPSLYRSVSAFYLVSETGPGMGEGLPLTPIEAMSCGTPVLVGAQDGSREILIDGGGAIFGPWDLNGQVEYLERLRTSPDFLASESLAAVERARDVFSYERFKSLTIHAIESLDLSRDRGTVADG